METLQAKVPLETYRKFREYMERHGIESRSDALRKLLAKALSDEAVMDSIRGEHRKTRKQMERLTEFVAGNLVSKKPLDPQRIREAVAKITKKSESME